MTETNHSQSIPVSPNVFPTKNKKMTEQPEKIYEETVMDIRSKVWEQVKIAE
jgi:5,10-methylenetetrahydrofolate reductase